MTRVRALAMIASILVAATSTAEEAGVRTFGGEQFRHGSAPFGLRFTCSGRRIVSFDSGLHVWDVETGREVLPTLPDHGVTRLLPDGHTLALYRDGGFLLDTEDGKRRELEFPVIAKGESVLDISPSLDFLVVTASDYRAQVVSRVDGSVLLTFPKRESRRENYREGAEGLFSPDGKAVAVWDQDAVLRIYDLSTRKELVAMDGGETHLDRVQWSPDGTFVMTTTHDWNDSSITVWGLDGCLRLSLPVSTDSVFAVRDDGGCIAWEHTWSEHPEIVLTDLATGETIRQLPLSSGVSGLAFSPDGKRLAAGMGSSIRFWDLESGTESARTGGHTDAIQTLAWAKNGRTLLTSSSDGTARLWDAETGADRRPWSPGVAVQGARWSPDEKQVLLWNADGFLGAFDAESGNSAWSRVSDTLRPGSLEWLSDGASLLYAEETERLRILDASNGKLTRSIPEPKPGEEESRIRFFRSGCDLSVSPDSHYAMVSWAMEGMNPGSVNYGVWDLTQREYEKLDSYTRGPAPTFAWSGDSRLVALAWDYFAEIRQAASGRTVRNFAIDRGNVGYMGSWPGSTSQALSPDGRYYVVCWNDASASLYDVVAGNLIQAGIQFPARVTTLAFSPDGLFLAAGLSNGIVQIVTLQPRLTPNPDLTLEDLWTRLGSDDCQEAWLARWCLAWRGDEGAAAILQRFEGAWRLDDVAGVARQLESGDVEIRKAAAAKIVARGGLTAAERRDVDADLSVEGRNRLEEIDAATGDPLALADPSLLVRLRAIDALGVSSSAEARNALQAIRDRSPSRHEREQAARILGARAGRK